MRHKYNNDSLFEFNNVNLCLHNQHSFRVFTNSERLKLEEINKLSDLTLQPITYDHTLNGTISVRLNSHGYENCINNESAFINFGNVENGFKLDNANKLTEDKFVNVYASFDHRTVDGADGAVFLKRVKEYIENPLKLL